MKKIFTTAILWLTLLGAIALTTQAQSYHGIIYVTMTGAGTHSGDSWANAISSIDSAQTLAEANGAVVWVAAGTYYGDTTSVNAFTMVEGVNVYGGFVGNEPADYDLSLRDFETNETVLDGQNSRRVLYQASNFSDTTRLDGFTIQNGQINGNGGGVFLRKRVVIRNCNISNNNANLGGGVYVAFGDAKIISCILSHNIGGTGGGVWAAAGTFITNCLISNNTANNNGGGILAYGSVVIRNSTIVRNLSFNDGSGIYGSTAAIMENCIVWGNGASNNVSGGISGCYCAVEGGCTGDNNILLSDYMQQTPMFVSPSLFPGAVDTSSIVDFHLQNGSICINRGNNSFVDNSFDLNGEGRIKYDTVDMGCYESEYNSVPVVAPNYSGIVYVSQNGSGTRTGEDWNNATSSINFANAMAGMNNVPRVWVSAGTYYGDTTANNAFTMWDGVSVYGGFAGDEPSDYDLSLRNFEANATILDGNSARRVLLQSYNFNNEAVWDGFVIQNGYSSRSGGGAYLKNKGVLRNCIVRDNISEDYGGGVYANPYGVSQPRSIISDCKIMNNNAVGTASYGGGIYAYYTTIDNSIIAHNTSNNQAGGIGVDNESMISNCQIFKNTNLGLSGSSVLLFSSIISNSHVFNNTSVSRGVQASQSSVVSNCQINNNSVGVGLSASVISNCLIYNNAIGIWDNGHSSVNNSTVVRNGNSGNDAGIIGNGTTLINSIVWGNKRLNGIISNITGTVFCSYSAIEGGYEGDSNISLSAENPPLFVNPSPVAGISDSAESADWHLQQGSPCINRGNSNAVLDSIDLDGNPRIKYDTVDMGCYEFDYDYMPVVEYDSIIYVTQTGAGNHSGNSWANAISSIDSAQTLAEANNAVVWVAVGTYYGDTLSENAFTMHNGVNVYGGFAGNEPVDFDLSLRNFETNATILDGQNTKRVLYQPSSFSNQTTWDGFVIQNGRTTGSGGGAYLYGNGRLNRCVIKNNTAYYGGGVCCDYNSSVSSCQVSNNTANGDGGGVYADFATVSNCLISNNTSSNGSGVYLHNSAVINSSVVCNACTSDGYGIYGYYDNNFLVNCIIWGNKIVGDSQRSTLANISGTLECTYSAIEGGYQGEGNVMLSDHEPFLPRFVNPSLNVGAGVSDANVDWHLMQGSPCINRGNNAAVTDSLDLEGMTRVRHDTVDMGCYESDYYGVPFLDVEYNGIVYVTQSGAGTQTGESWTNAVASIEDAQALAVINDAVVWVASGTYYGDSLSSSYNAFSMHDGVNVYGGFSGNEPEDFDLSQRDFETNVTILDGQNARRVLSQTCKFNAQTMWDGFTIQNGNTMYTGDGVWLDANGILNHCIIQNNSAVNGGGVFAKNGGIVTNCKMFNNTADYGGGLLASDAVVYNCLIMNNTAGISGGGVYADYSTFVDGCMIHDNTATYGGGLYVYNNPTVAKSKIYNNAADYGGGVFVFDNSIISNCQIANNVAIIGGGGVYSSDASSIISSTIVRNIADYGPAIYGGYENVLVNSIVWGNGIEENDNFEGSISCTYSAIEGGYEGDNIISLSAENPPLFVKPSPIAGISDSAESADWHLQQGSPCINRGNNLSVADSVDLDGNPRVKYDTVDLGCYESDYYSEPIAEYDSIIYVTQTGAGTHSGDSWENALSSIEEAQTLAQANNAVVWVAAGTYYGDTTAVNAFTMHDGVSVYGSFAGNEPADYDLSLRNFEANATILDGQNTRRVLNQPFNFNAKAVWSGFTFRNGQTSGSGAGALLRGNGALDSCVVTGCMSGDVGGGIYANGATVKECVVSGNICNGSYDYRQKGGGIYAESSTVTGCRAAGNSAHEGGGIYSKNTTVTGCQLENNSASNGGGAYSYASTVSTCIATDNHASSNGGGLYISSGYWDSPSTATCCCISHNSANSGGGIYTNYSTSVVNSCIVSNNTASGSGGGIGMGGGGTVSNSTVARNASGGDGAGVHGDSYATLANCIVWGNERNGYPNNINGNSVNCSHSAIEGGYSGTEILPIENVGIYPHGFVNPSLTAGISDSTENVDWHLTSGSACINRGDNSVVADSLDLDGTTRIKRDTVDLGCYESDYYSVPLVEYDGVVYVTVDGAGNYSGDSWANALSTIEGAQAIAQANNAVVWVAAGIYFGDTLSENAFVMKDGVSVYGGFAGNELADYDLSLRDFETNATILDGQNTRRVLNQPFNFNAKAVWSGFTLRNGQSTGSGAGALLRGNGALDSCLITGCVSGDVGGGVYANGATVKECVVSGNTCTSSSGGGIYANSSTIYANSIFNNNANGGGGGIVSIQSSVSGCRIESNTGKGNGGGISASNSTVSNCWIYKNINNSSLARGGGIYASNTIVTNCQIDSNIVQSSSYAYGGGMYASVSTILNCQMSSNVSFVSGGGMYAYASSVSNCLFSNNNSNYFGGGVYAEQTSVVNSTIVRNTSGRGGSGIFGTSNISWIPSTLSNSIVWGNEHNGTPDNTGGSFSCSHSAIEGGYEGDSIITLGVENQPLFVNPSLTAGTSDSTENVDWRLLNGSVCVNHGNNDAVTDTLDLDGTARVKRDTVDLGCYESDYYSVPVLLCSSVYHEFSDTACDTYSWNDQTYTQSGSFIQSFELPNGCDSIVTLHLTVNHSVTTHEYLTTCASDLPYAYKDTLLDVSTPQLLTINSHLLTQNGCDSTVVLQLTVLPSTVGEFATMTPTDNYPLTNYPIHFTWDAVENASGYELYVWPVGEPQPQQPTAANIYGTSYVLHTLPNRANYQWMMKAYNACDTSVSSIRQFSLNVAPSLTVNANNPVDFGEVQLNSARSVFFQVNGIALDSAITYQITGADTAAFSLAPTNSWNSMSGGRMQLTFHPQTLQNEFTAQMTIQSNDLVRTFAVKGYLADFLTFTTYVDSNVYAMDSDIPVHGQVINALNEPVSGLDVEVYVKVMDYVRTYPATSDANGQFTITFTPQHSEAGYYTVGSRRAGSNSSAVHDEFNIPGMMLVSSDNILWEPTIDQPDSGTIAIRNRSQIPLTNIQVTPISLPNGCTVQFAPLSLAGMATGELQYTVGGSQISTGVNYEEVRLNAVSNEGAGMSFTAWYYCLPQRADLDVTPISLATTMTRGQSKIVDFKIYNNGTGPTGNIYVSLPNVPWMSVVGSDTLPSLAVHDSAYVSIRLSADSTTALVRYTGNIAVNCERGEGVSIPYDITAISDSTGTLVVDVTDEYTWNTNNGHGPHLAGANVIVKGYYSLETVATGVTDANGLFVVNDLPEGYYKLIVRADRHAEYQGNLLVTASDTNRQDIFIQFQAITYSWNVVPTEIEDEYTYELNVEFETHVPKPVVVLDMPENIPALEEGESFTFDYVLTNYGLVSTYDVQLFTPENEEYNFTPLINHLDSLPAQTTVVVPCVMSRNVSPQPVMLAHHSGSANTSKSSKSEEPCQYMIVSQTLSYYSCAGEQRPIEAYVVRYIGNVPCTTYPTNTSNIITFYPTNPPVYTGGNSSSSFSWNSAGNVYYVVPPITIPLDTCECQDIVNRDTTIIYDMDTVLFINGTDDYNFVAFCDSCDSMVIICTTINNCITGEITYYCDTLSSLGPDTMGSGQGGGPEPPAPDSTNCGLKITKIWGSGDSYFNQLLSNQDYEVKGVVADGTSIMIIQVRSDCVFGQPIWILEYQGEGDSRYTGTIISENRTDHLLEFVYKAPEEFPMAVNKEYTVNFVVHVSAGDSVYTKIVPISVIRPPVLMVHGLNSDGDCFNTLHQRLIGGMYNSWQLQKVDYRNTNLESFLVNLNVVQNNIRDCFTYIVKNNYVVSKADIVGHSMGGILARLHVQYVNNSNVHKIITLNTPHSGSSGANYIMNNWPVRNASCAMFNNVGHYLGGVFGHCNLDAVNELQVDSYATRYYLNNSSVLYRMNDIPIHAISTTAIVTDENIDRIRNNKYVSVALALLKIAAIYDKKASIANNVINAGLDLSPCVITTFSQNLFGEQNDLVVGLKSQRGGVPNNCQTTYDGDFDFCHIESPNNPLVINRIKDLLKRPVSDTVFCKSGFHPDTIHYPSPSNIISYVDCILTSEETPILTNAGNKNVTENYNYADSVLNSFIQVTVSHDEYSHELSIFTNHSDNIENTMIISVLQSGEVLADMNDTLISIVPLTYRGPVLIYAIGQTPDGNVIMDSVAILINNFATTPQNIVFVEDTLFLITSETVYPTLQCAWANGDTTYVTPTFIADSSIVSIEDGAVRGIHAGTTELIAQFEGLTTSIPVIVYGWDFDDDNNSSNENDSLTHNTVCASVTVQFSQKMTMTREAFEGTLTINNGHESQPMQDIDVDFVIKDENGVDCTNLFQINFLSYNNVTGTNGNASLDAQNTGSIVVQFIPTKQAAPEIAKQYSFGGSFSFIDPFTGESMTYNLYPVDIMVNPSPDLYVNYFMQRDILGDDPLTENRVEPIIPAELGVIIHNRGTGTAKNVLLETAEPRIIDNDKGSAVDFAMYGAAFNGQERQLGLMEIPFGNIEPNRTGVGEWWFTSTLLGHFVSYEAHVIHNNSFGNPDLSLVSSLDIHPLIHTVYAYGNLDDGINDFLVDDVEDSQNYPDSLYFSNGSRTGVATADSIGFDHYVIPMDTIVILTLDPSRIGWNYEQTWDPGRGQYKLISCTRNSDQQEIPLSNVWQTHVTLPVGADPIYENKLHIVDTLSNDLPTTYTLVFSLSGIVLEVDTILNIPDTIALEPLTSVTVKFNKPVVDSTFDYQDMTLKCNNGENLLDASMVVERIDSMTYNLLLNDYTQQSGLFVLNIQTLDITDAEGYNGYYAEQAQWIQSLTHYEDLYDTVCDSTEYTFHGDYLNASGLYLDTLRNISDTYDSVIYRLHLTVNYTTTSDTTAVACDSFTWHGVTYSESGDYPFILTNTNGCDSVVTLHLTVNYSNTGDTTAVACDSYDWYEQTGITTSGEYTHTFTNTSGCDSVVTLHLTVNYSNIGDTTAVACDSFDWYEHTGLTTSGDYTHTFTNTSGCDSVVTLHLTVNYSNTGDTSAVACGSFDWYGETLTETAEYTRIFTNASGCDSVVTLHLTINNPVHTAVTATACESFLWNGTTYTQSGTYTYSHPDANGCTQVDTLHLTIHNPIHTAVSETSCESFLWNGTLYTQSGIYTYSHSDANGCTQVDTLHLTIHNPVHTATTETACESFTWNGTTYTQSGTYTYGHLDANGCTQVDTLHLTINNPVHTAVTEIACSSFLWNGILYTQSGTYTFSHLDANGCTQVDTLHLTIHNPVHTAVTETACESFTWNGITYTQSGTYTHGHLDANGCTQVDTLHLIIHNPVHIAVTETACESFTWNGIAYTQSGTYTFSHLDVNGCTQVDTLHLIIHNPVHTAVTETSCVSFLWNGTLYTQSGTYTFSHLDVNGCTQVDTLHLTIYNPVHTAVSETACANFVWNGISYTQSGAYTQGHLDANGCTQVDTLHLTINQPTTGDTTAVACDSFTWNGNTYTESGDYTSYLTNVAGCDSVVTLHLTINPSNAVDTTVFACESFTWNGTTYTESGDYTTDQTNAAGCDSVVTLHLTIADAPALQAISGETEICLNQFATYTYDISEPDYQYRWFKDNALWAENVPQVTLHEMGEGSVLLTMSVADEQNGCAADTSLLVQVVNRIAPDTTEIRRKGSTNILICQSVTSDYGEVHYRWGYTNRFTYNEATMPGDHNYCLYDFGIDTMSYLYWVETYLNNPIGEGCDNRSYYGHSVLTSTSDYDANTVEAYISRDHIILYVSALSPENVSASLYDVNGKLLLTRGYGITDVVSDAIAVNIAPGVYFLRVSVGNEFYSFKLLKL